MKQTLAALLVLSVLGMPLALGASTAAAQAAEPMTIEFGSPRGLPFTGVDAYIGTTLCGSVRFDDSATDGTIDGGTMEIGGPDAPAACNATWRVIELRGVGPDGDYPMFVAPVFQPGGSIRVENYGPFPIADGPDVHFGIQVITDGLTARDLKLLGGISAYVDGTHCGTAPLDETEDAAWIPVSHRDNPAICREYGQAITLVDGNGHVLVVSPTVGVGPFYRLENLAPYPPGTGPTAPVPAAAGHGRVEGARDSSMPLALLGALAVAALGLLGARTAARPRR